MTVRVKESLRLADALTRLWADDRFTAAPRTRGFINAWLITRHAIADHDEVFRETLRRVDADRPYGWQGILREDRPRFDGMPDWKDRRCSTPKTRGPNAGEPCGKSAATQFRITDPATGEWTYRGWCRDHQRDADIMRAREQSLTNIPEPLPNRGGLLPCYIRATNWPDLYASADPRWKPPYVGIVADDWPILARTQDAPRMKLALTALDGAGGEQPTGSTPPPALRLVTS